MEIKDLILTPFYLILIYLMLFIIRRRMIKDREIKRYFIPAITLKIIGALAVGFIYQFYYEGGDTFGYFTNGSRHIWDAFLEHPWKGVQLLLDSGEEYNANTIEYASQIDYYGNAAAYLIVKISGIFGLVTFHTYAIIAIFFALFSFSGVWALYITLYRLYPHLHKQFAIACFFVPSLFFWGSGVLKDSVTFGVLGWCFYALYHLFIIRQNLIRSALIFLLSIYILKVVKIYILICFIPSMAIYIILHNNNRIKSKAAKILLKPFFLITAIFLGIYLSYKISESDEFYRFDKILETAYATSSWLSTASKLNNASGSYYDLGEFEFTPLGILSKFPQATWVSLFRPYPWESKNLVMLISSFESLFFLLLTLYVIIRTGFWKTLSIIRQNPFVLFLFVFSITFAFAIGLSTWNFGSLVRYRIPIIPFYLAGLAIIWDTGRRRKKKLNSAYEVSLVKHG